MKCAVNGCNESIFPLNIYCDRHITLSPPQEKEYEKFFDTKKDSMAVKYPKYYKPIPKGMTEIDFYGVCKLFNVTDAALSHSLKKLLLPGVRTGGKSRRDDIKEARDTLNRWLELNPEDQIEVVIKY